MDPIQEMQQLFVEDDFPPIIPRHLQELPLSPVEAGDWAVPPEDPASRFPLPVYFRLGETFRANVLQVVSPLEFYIIRHEDLLESVSFSPFFRSISDDTVMWRGCWTRVWTS